LKTEQRNNLLCAFVGLKEKRVLPVNADAVVLCSAVKFVSIIKSDVVVSISHFFLVEIGNFVSHMRIVQVILTCSLNKYS